MRAGRGAVSICWKSIVKLCLCGHQQFVAELADSTPTESPHPRPQRVVGKQPHLNPGETFRYSSGAVLDTPVGSMYGSYHMLTDNGADFSAPIAPFTLAVPGILH